MSVCTCPTPETLKTHRAGQHECGACGGFACGYADRGQATCPHSRCDCFVETHPDSPMALHPEMFTVGAPLVCNCGEVWRGHPNPHAITCPLHVRSSPGTPTSGES